MTGMVHHDGTHGHGVASAMVGSSILIASALVIALIILVIIVLGRVRRLWLQDRPWAKDRPRRLANMLAALVMLSFPLHMLAMPMDAVAMPGHAISQHVCCAPRLADVPAYAAPVIRRSYVGDVAAAVSTSSPLVAAVAVSNKAPPAAI